MLFKTKIDRGESAAVIRNIIYDKRAGKLIATSSITTPIEAAYGRIARGIANQVAIVTGLQLA
jgi:hypothetical protein